MKVLNIAPPAEWRAFDEDLSFEIRRLPMRDLVSIIEGTRLQEIMETPLASRKDGVTARLPLAELLDLGEEVVERMVTAWTVEGPSGDAVPVTGSAARWLMSDVSGLAGWLVFDVLCQALAVEGKVEQEKKG